MKYPMLPTRSQIAAPRYPAEARGRERRDYVSTRRAHVPQRIHPSRCMDDHSPFFADGPEGW